MSKKKRKVQQRPQIPAKLSLCMIVKNEERNIEKALDWAKDIVFEIIVVDTGSTDRTIEIAKRMGAKVYHFEWINDFAAAKNYAIEQATGDWIVLLDADEYFPSEDAAKIVPFLTHIQSDPALYKKWLIIQCSLTNLDEAGNTVSISHQERIFRNIPDIRYSGAIHERLNVPVENALFGDDIMIIHTGYTRTAYEETGKVERNIGILNTELKTSPNDLNLKAYLADALKAKAQLRGNYADALNDINRLYYEVVNGGADVLPQIRINAFKHLLEVYSKIPEKKMEFERLSQLAVEFSPENRDFLNYHAPIRQEMNEIRNKKNAVRAQFEEEAKALKAVIYEFINSGQIIMAAQILEQYALLDPSDPDINEIRTMLYPPGAQIHSDDVIPEQYSILDKIETVFILSGIITRRTGYIDSVIRKIRLMEDKWNYSPLLLTCIHNIDNRKAQTWLQTAADGQVALGVKTRMLNVYEFFQKSYIDGLANKAVYDDSADDKNDKNADDGVTIKKYYTGYMGSLREVRYFKNGNADKDLVYDDWGYLNCIREYSPLSEDIYDVKYYTTDGKICIEALFRPTNEGITQEKLFLYDDNGEVAAECANSAELAALCLERIMADDKLYMLVVEDGLMSKAATMAARGKSNVKRCAVVHSIFLNDAYIPGSGPQPYYKYLCENRSEFDGIVMLTEEARKDFELLYGNTGNIFVIPHPYPHEISRVDFNKRDNTKAVVVARLDPFKQIELTIDIFDSVVKKLPDAILEIYGRGPEEEKLRDRIKKLGLEKNITLMGYTDKPLVAFNAAVLSIMTSKAEGFGLTLMESICNGCPAFAFDIKYGPSEIIEDGRTGFLFPRFDVEKFATKVVAYFKDEDMQRTMIGNCYDAASKFNSDKLLESWYKMTEIMCKTEG